MLVFKVIITFESHSPKSDIVWQLKSLNYWSKMKKYFFPIPGVEPGPPGWKPGILTARPYGNWTHQLDVFDKSAWFVGFDPWLVKRAISGFSTCFSSSVAKQVVRFCCPFYRSLTNGETMKKKRKAKRVLSRGLIKTVIPFITVF